MTELWTIGHGARPLAEFLAALSAHRIGVVADVRSYPVSRRHPHFSQAPLRAALEGVGLGYAHLAGLGGFRDAGYEAHMATPEWRAGFAELAALAAEARVAVMCAETEPAGCHRRFIAGHAAGLGWAVTHILDARRARPGAGPRQARLDETEGS